VLSEYVERLQTVDEIIERYSITSYPVRSRIFTGVGVLFVFFAIIGIFVPGWPTVSWAVPAAYFFSISNERLFRWTLTNRHFGPAIFEYYSTGKTIPKHAKYGVIFFIGIMSIISSYFVWYVSTRGDGVLFDRSSWNGADPGFGASTILAVGLIGIWYVGAKVGSRDSN
jgi:uncharacterized membrane protein YbaN (DUF454 family)